MEKIINLIRGIFLFVSLLPISAQNNNRILIAYFTWADNTVIIDRDRAVREANNHVFSMENSLSADTTTSASVLPPGNTRKLAGWIQNNTRGDLYSIRVKNKYSCYWDECLDRASEEKARRKRPELIDPVKNMADYDVIFLGFPTWWYTIPMAVAAFVEENDLSGKKVIPFVSHGTSGIARTIRDLSKLLPRSASLEKEIGIYRSETDQAEARIKEWIKSSAYFIPQDNFST